jgi:predicted amidohydrolase
MSRPFNIACLQTRPKPDFGTALNEALSLAEAARGAGAQMLALPEYCGGLRTDGALFAPPHARESDHPFLNGIRDYARDKSLWIMIGSIAITGRDGKFYNRGFMIGPDGEIRSRYDKLHLFDIQLSETEVYRESARVIPGDATTLIETPFAKIGHTICYDLRFAQLYRELAQDGAEILAVPAAFTKKTGEAHWHVLNRARAIENGAFVISPCAIGPVEGGGESYGHSLIVDPWGRVVADGGALRGVVQATIDLDEVAKARGRIPSLQHDVTFDLTPPAKKDVA